MNRSLFPLFIVPLLVTSACQPNDNDEPSSRYPILFEVLSEPELIGVVGYGQTIPEPIEIRATDRETGDPKKGQAFAFFFLDDQKDTLSLPFLDNTAVTDELGRAYFYWTLHCESSTQYLGIAADLIDVNPRKIEPVATIRATVGEFSNDIWFNPCRKKVDGATHVAFDGQSIVVSDFDKMFYIEDATREIDFYKEIAIPVEIDEYRTNIFMDYQVIYYKGIDGKWYLSRDFGDSWSSISVEGVLKILVINEVLYGQFGSSIYVSTDWGVTWQFPQVEGLISQQIVAIAEFAGKPAFLISSGEIATISNNELDVLQSFDIRIQEASGDFATDGTTSFYLSIHSNFIGFNIKTSQVSYVGTDDTGFPVVYSEGNRAYLISGGSKYIESINGKLTDHEVTRSHKVMGISTGSAYDVAVDSDGYLYFKYH